MEKTAFEKDLYSAFLNVAYEMGDEVFKMSCYAKYGKFSTTSNLDAKIKSIKKVA